MKFISSTLTLSLKFIFFVTFTIGLLLISILNTYLDRSYYENYFADGFAEIQSQHVERILKEKESGIPFNISADTINEVFKQTFSAENIKLFSDTLFDSIENYEGDDIVIDLTFLKKKEAEFIDKISESVVSSPELQKEVKNYLSKNINFGIPANFEIEITDTGIDKVLRTIKFIVTKKLVVTLIILAFMFLPLVGIFTLNAHPYCKGFKKVGFTLMVAGALTTAIESVSRILIKSFYLNGFLAEQMEEMEITLNGETVGAIFDLAFGKMLQIITFTGLVTLGAGLILYVMSRVMSKRYGYTG